jgi:phytoene dehydrogenase-like protein
MTYDVIVVGGGAAGLTAAAYAARAGRTAALFERQAELGGLVQSVNRDGFVFDMGLRAIENSGIVLPMVAELGLPLEYIESRVSVGIADRVMAVESEESLADYERLLELFYPDSGVDIRRIMEVIRRIMRDMDVLYGIDNPLFKDLTSDYAYIFRTLLPWSLRFLVTIGRINRMNAPVEDLLAELTSNESLRSIVGQHFFRYTPAFFAMSYFSVYLDYLYPKGGTGTLMHLLADYGADQGVSIDTGNGIAAVDPERRTVTCDDGAEHEYRSLVWAADLNTLYASIDLSRLSDARRRRAIEARRDELAQYEGGDSVFSVFLSVDEPPAYFGSKSHGHFFYTPDPRGLGDRHTKGLETLVAALEAGRVGWDEIADYLRGFLARNTFEISIPVLKDPSMAPPGKTGLIVSWLFDYRLTRVIRERGWYDELKELCMDEAVRVLSASVYPGIGAKIIDRFATTPHSIAARTGSTGGAITGWALGPGAVPVVHKMQQVSAAVATPVPDVYQAGQWAYSPSGLPIAILTGKLAAQRAVRRAGPARGPRPNPQ